MAANSCTAKQKRMLAVMDRQVPWSKFKGNSVVCHVAQQGFEVFGWDDWAQADVCVVSVMRKDKLRDKIRWRTVLPMCWLLSITAAMGEQGLLVKYKPALHKLAK